MRLRDLVRGWRLVALLVLPVIAAAAAGMFASDQPAQARATLRLPVPVAEDAAPSVITQRIEQLTVALRDPEVISAVAPETQLNRGPLRSGLSARRAGGADVLVATLDGPADRDLEGALEAVMAAAVVQVLGTDLAAVDAAADAALERVEALEVEHRRAVAATGFPLGAEDYRTLSSLASQLRLRALEARLDPDGVDESRIAALEEEAEAIEEQLDLLGAALLRVEAVEDRLGTARRTHEQLLQDRTTLAARQDRALAGVPGSASQVELSTSLAVTQAAVSAGVLALGLTLLALAAIEAARRSRAAAATAAPATEEAPAAAPPGDEDAADVAPDAGPVAAPPPAVERVPVGASTPATVALAATSRDGVDEADADDADDDRFVRLGASFDGASATGQHTRRWRGNERWTVFDEVVSALAERHAVGNGASSADGAANGVSASAGHDDAATPADPTPEPVGVGARGAEATADAAVGEDASNAADAARSATGNDPADAPDASDTAGDGVRDLADDAPVRATSRTGRRGQGGGWFGGLRRLGGRAVVLTQSFDPPLSPERRG